MKIYFVTTNTFKASETRDYFDLLNARAGSHFALHVLEHQVQEILHPDLDVVVKHKALQAYRYLRRPCVVEHGGLFMDALPGLPGSLGKIIWEAVGDRLCDFLRAGDSREAVARSVIGYCDGRRVHLYCGETRGRIAERARGDYVNNWDPIFIPEGHDQTYGEMGPEKKRATSQATRAWDAFLQAQFPNDIDPVVPR